MNSNATRITFETRRDIANGALTNAFLPAGSPYANPCRILKIVNNTDAVVGISFDGLHAHDAYVPTSAGVYDFTAARQANADQAEQPEHTQVYIRYEGSAPTTGSVYIIVIYASVN